MPCLIIIFSGSIHLTDLFAVPNRIDPNGICKLKFFYTADSALFWDVHTRSVGQQGFCAIYGHIQTTCGWIRVSTIWLLNIAMDSGPFCSMVYHGLPIKNGWIFHGYVKWPEGNSPPDPTIPLPDLQLVGPTEKQKSTLPKFPDFSYVSNIWNNIHLHM